jgi:hypothetical protein
MAKEQVDQRTAQVLSGKDLVVHMDPKLEDGLH